MTECVFCLSACESKQSVQCWNCAAFYIIECCGSCPNCEAGFSLNESTVEQDCLG